ncbi:hypothetical protein Cme02nite_20640 [Catellatospora methionotrophica]|uniref:DUF2029 domain-containing protein n=2 Tax=Catellatospora methionotrophica TaxID=121620 RepID=A0A8J3L7M0_9ACTN|nr:hypothetical protein Cme02nite_20640 [Catellatospora methionotrophica]
MGLSSTKASVAAGIIWATAIGIVTVYAFAALRRPPSDTFADLAVYYGSVRTLIDDGSLYIFAAQNGDPFTYPPFAGLVLSPLGLITESTAGWLWFIGTVSLIVILSVAIGSKIRGRNSEAAPWWTPAVAVVLFVSAPMSSNIRFGQISWVLVALVLIDALKIVPARHRGIATGVASALKLTPLIFIPYYWLSGQRRTAFMSLATFAGCTGVAWLLLPSDSSYFWFELLSATDRIGDLSNGGNQSINGMLLRLGINGVEKFVILILLSAAILALGLWRGVRASRNEHLVVGASVIGATAIAISPVSWTHHQVWLVFAAAASFDRRWTTYLWRTIALVIMIVPLGTITAKAFPAAAQLGGNARGLLALAVAGLLPFTEIAKIGTTLVQSHSILRFNIPSQSTDKGAGSKIMKMAIPCLAATLLLGGCGNTTPEVLRPSGQQLVMTLSSGEIDGVKWQVEVVRIGVQSCTQSVVHYQIMGNDCEVGLKMAEVPVNIAVEGNAKILFVRGVVGSQVARIISVTQSRPSGEPVKISTVDGVRYFGYAVKPSDAVDLVGYDATGQMVYSGASKILSTRDDR